MKFSVADLMQRLPGKASEQWPTGEPFVQAMAHGTMSVELYAPTGSDSQTPHDQDELYFIHSGSGTFVLGPTRHSFAPGDCFFVAAGFAHRFESFTEDFSTWVVFWGPKGGEATQASPDIRATTGT